MSQAYREFDADQVLAKINVNTVNLNDFEMITPTIAKVVVSFTGDFKGEQFLEAVAKLFVKENAASLAQPIRDSWKKLTRNSAVGFISANPEVRTYEVEEKGKYRTIAKNLLMDRDDETTWELVKSEAGEYLCRRGMDDLSEVSTTLRSHKVGIPSLMQLAFSAVARNEFIAFVDKKEAEVDYGFVVGKSKTNNPIVLSQTSEKPMEVDSKCIIHSTALSKEDKQPEGFKELAAESDEQKVIKYWQTYYRYSPEYVNMFIDMIKSMNFA